MIIIKNTKIFTCKNTEKYHWSKLTKLKDLMFTESFRFQHNNLRDADLRHANLSSADLYMTDLQFAKLYNADLRHANLSSADLYSADLRHADLRHANLSSADLYSADLRSAYLQHADLRGADLQLADLQHADLRGADLQYAKLRGAKLKPINYEEVTVEDFMSVSGLGSQNRQTLIFNTNIGIVIQCGCFYGTEKEFKKKVKETHGNNSYAKEYLEMLKLAKIRFNRKD